MEERYPYLRFVIGAAQLLAGAVAAVVILGGTLRACHFGGFGGVVALLAAVIIASVAWIATMATIESIQLFLDIEQHTRKIAERPGGPT
jgi:hypothetical protein